MPLQAPEAAPAISPQVKELLGLQIRTEGKRVVFINPNQIVDDKPAEVLTLDLNDDNESQARTFRQVFEIFFGSRAMAIGMNVDEFIEAMFANPNNVFKNKTEGEGENHD